MQYLQDVSHYHSPLGDMLLAADEIGLTGLWFEGQKYFARGLSGLDNLSNPRNSSAQCASAQTASPKYASIEGTSKQTLPIFETAKRWLDVYFSGREPDFSVPIHLIGTDFQKEVWQILCTIPYGQAMTYGEIANKLAQKRQLAHMSAQAVGGAVGRNPLSIFVPCHRVLGANGSLTGYAGGIDKKRTLLRLEGIELNTTPTVLP